MAEIEAKVKAIIADVKKNIFFTKIICEYSKIIVI